MNTPGDISLTRIGQISVNVPDLDRATTFYKDKLGMKHLFSVPPKMAFFDCEGIRLMLAIPERPGNRRADGYLNILSNPHVGLNFFVPGRNDTLRINGRARLVRDAPYFDEMVVKGHRPVLAIEVDIDVLFYHCAKAFMRSDLWKPESWYDRATLPTLGQILRDQLALADSAEATDRWLDDDYKQTMW